MKILRKILRGLFVLVLAVVVLAAVALGGLYATDPIKMGRYYSALIKFRTLSADMEWWTPKDIVKGVAEPSPIPTAESGEKTIDQAALESVVDWANDKNTVALIVAHKGVIQLEKYWPGFDANTVVDTASMHKSIVGLMMGYALEDGYIKSLEDPVRDYIPEWGGDLRGNITLRAVMQMSSGLKPDQFSFSPFSRTIEYFMGSDVEAVTLATEYEQEPGLEFQYSSGNSQLLGIVLERATGKTLAEYESERLWKPLGADDASLFLDREGGMARTFCCFHTTARGWLRLGIMLANRGVAQDGRQVVDPAWLAQWTMPAPTNPQYGMQVWLGADFVGDRSYHRYTTLSVPHQEPIEADDMFYFDGAVGNRLYVIPSKELVIVRTGLNTAEWEESFIPNTLIRGIKDDAGNDDTANGDEVQASAEIPEDDTVFWNRFNNLPEDIMEAPTAWYDPVEPIAGATTPVEFAAVDQPVISADAIAEAERFAKANNSTALVVLYDGKLAHEVYWDGYSRDTEFSSHSMVKTLTGLAVATAQADGFIDSFDDPVSKYLPEAAGRPFADRTIRQLLHMASGVETVPLSRDPGSKIVQLSYGSDILSTALSFDMAAAPDTNFNHDNSHSILLGAIVSAATGQRYADYVSARIWNPIGARTAKLFLDRPGGTPHTDCCMASHPMDWIKVGEFLRNKGRVGGEQVVPETAIEAMLEPSPGNPNYGFQIWLGTPYTENRSYRGDLRGSYHSEPYLADDLFFLDGFGGKRVYVIPSRKLVIMRLGTSSDTWDDAVLPNTIMRGLIADSGSN